METVNQEFQDTSEAYAACIGSLPGLRASIESAVAESRVVSEKVYREVSLPAKAKKAATQQADENIRPVVEGSEAADDLLNNLSSAERWASLELKHHQTVSHEQHEIVQGLVAILRRINRMETALGHGQSCNENGQYNLGTANDAAQRIQQL
jgi:hypothetical protein